MDSVWLNKKYITQVLHRDLYSDACCRSGLVILPVGMVTCVLEERAQGPRMDDPTCPVPGHTAYF